MTDVLPAATVTDPSALELEPLELPADQIVAGAPKTFIRTLRSWGDWASGVWEITPGTVTDVEADEAFVVLSGRATVRTQDGEVLELGPGATGTFAAGVATTWEVHETLRKVFVARAS
jgi:uncharacterized cupin superfamily protein